IASAVNRVRDRIERAFAGAAGTRTPGSARSAPASPMLFTAIPSLLPGNGSGMIFTLRSERCPAGSVVPPGEVYREPGNRFSKEFTAVSSTFLVLQNGRGNAIRDRTHFRAAFPLEEHNEHQSGEPPGNPRGAFSAAPFAP